MQINIEKLKREMERAGINNNAEFADRLEMTRQAIDYILAQKTTTFKTLNKMAEVLGLDAKDLLK